MSYPVQICVLLVVAALGACTQEADFSPPEAEGPAEDFIAAWDQGDASAMVDLFHEDAAAEWSERRLDRVLQAVVHGVVQSIGVEEDGEVDQTEVDSEEELEEQGLEASVPYAVSYESEALNDPAVLEGEFEMSYDAESDRWGVLWSKELLWPGVEGAVGFAVKTRWRERGPILDRKGRKLAKGTGANRSYPFGASAGITVGHLEPVGKQDAIASEGEFQEGDLVGASGLELAYQERLAGTPSTKLQAVDRKGKALDTLGTRRGKPGKPVRATLDIRVQQAAEAAYGSTTGERRRWIRSRVTCWRSCRPRRSIPTAT